GIPDVFFQITGCEPTGKAELATDGLPYGFPIKGPRHGIDDAVRDGSVVFMSMVIGCDVVLFVLEHGLREKLDPSGRNTTQVRIDNHACLGLQPFSDGKDRSEGASLAGKTVIRSADPIADLNWMRNQQQVIGAAFRFQNHIFRLILRTAVRVHNDGASAGKVLGQSKRYRTHNVANVSGV